MGVIDWIWEVILKKNWGKIGGRERYEEEVKIIKLLYEIIRELIIYFNVKEEILS